MTQATWFTGEEGDAGSFGLSEPVAWRALLAVQQFYEAVSAVDASMQVP